MTARVGPAAQAGCTLWVSPGPQRAPHRLSAPDFLPLAVSFLTVLCRAERFFSWSQVLPSLFWLNCDIRPFLSNSYTHSPHSQGACASGRWEVFHHTVCSEKPRRLQRQHLHIHSFWFSSSSGGPALLSPAPGPIAAWNPSTSRKTCSFRFQGRSGPEDPPGWVRVFGAISAKKLPWEISFPTSLSSPWWHQAVPQIIWNL